MRRAGSCFALLMGLTLFGGGFMGSESAGVTVLDLRMEGEVGRVLTDSSGFRNDAEAVGMPYEEIFKRFERKNGGWALKVGNCVGSKSPVCGALIRPAASLLAARPEIEFEIKPLAKRQLRPVNNILRAQVSPFFYAKEKKAPACGTFYPLQVNLTRKNRLQMKYAWKDQAGEVKTSTCLGPELPIDRFSQVKWRFFDKNVVLSVDGKEVKSWPCEGKILYDHPDYYPGYVAWFVGSGLLDAQLDNLKVVDPDLGERQTKVGLKIKTEYDMNFFTQDEKKRFFVDLETFGETSREGELRYKALDHENREIFQGSRKVVLEPKKANRIEIEIPSERRGCFWLNCRFLNENGEVLAQKEESYAVGAVRDVKEHPDSSIFGLDTSDTGRLRNVTPPLGAKWIRMWFRGDKFSPKEGEIKWELFDKAVAHHVKAGRKLMVCMMGTPEWLVDKKAQELKEAGVKFRRLGALPPEDWDKYEAYLCRVIERYRDQVDVWEIWNEANTASWGGTPEEFVKLMKITHRLVRELDPSAKVLGPSVASEAGWSPWAGEVLELGGGPYMDIYTYHYGGGGFSAHPNPEIIPRQSKDTHDMLKHYGRDLPIWDGETGYIIATRRGRDNRPTSKKELERRQNNKEGFLHNSMVARPGQANNSRAFDERSVSDLWLRKIALDLASGIGKIFQHPVGWMTYGRYGQYYCRHSDGVLLPAVVWTTAVEKLNNAKFIRKIDLDEDNLYAYLFQNQGDKDYLAILWKPEGRSEINLWPDSDEVAELDKFGNSMPLRKIDDGMVQVELGPSPIYLENVGEKIKLGEKYLSVKVPEVVAAAKVNLFQVKVHNSRKKELSGRVEVDAPRGIEVEPREFQVKVAPGGDFLQEVTVAPSMALSGQKNQIELFLRENGGKRLSSATTMFLIAKAPAPIRKKTGEIVVDGQIGEKEWDNCEPLILEREEQVVLGRPICYGDPATWKRDVEWCGPDDLSGEAKLRHDGENLYLLVKVKDNHHVISERKTRPWLSDGVEFFLDCRSPEEQKKNFYTPGVVHLVLSPGDGKNPKALWRRVGKSGSENGRWKIETASRKTAEGYVLEAKIPLDKTRFPALKVENGAVIGLDVVLVDSDKPGKRKTQMVWRGTSGNYKDPSKFGKVVFQDASGR